MNIKDLKVGQKIISGFSVVAFLALVIGITGVIGMRSIGKSFDVVANESLNSVYYIGEIEVKVLNVYQDLLRLIDPNLDRSQREQIEENVSVNRSDLGQLLIDYGNLEMPDEERALYDEVVKLIDSWRGINQQILRMNTRFLEMDLLNPTQIIGKVEGFIKDHHVLQLKALTSIRERNYFEGGESAEDCAFGKWITGFRTQNASLNNHLRSIRQSHARFHEATAVIKSSINKGNVDAAYAHYSTVMQPAAMEVFGILNLINEDAHQAQEILDQMNESITSESNAQLIGFSQRFGQLKVMNQLQAQSERESGSNTLVVSNMLIVLAILIGVALSLILGLLITRNIATALKRGVVFAENIAKGDLSVNFDGDILEQKDEIGQLGRALQRMVEQLKQIIGDVLSNTENINAASFEMSSSSQQVSQGASEQASSVEEISSSMEQMLSNIQQNSESAMKTEAIANNASKGIRDVSEMALGATQAMKEIASKVSIIGEIAYKTNILALNAAVEAARAGEHGQGFAVVADEVRKLAESSQIAADEIDGLANNSVGMADEAGRRLMEIAPEIEKTAVLVQEIAAGSMEQSAGAEQVNGAILQLNQVVQQNAAAAEEMASSSEELASQSDLMKEVISYFSIGNSNLAQVASNKANKKRSAAPVSHKKMAGTPANGFKLDLGENDPQLGEFERF